MDTSPASLSPPRPTLAKRLLAWALTALGLAGLVLLVRWAGVGDVTRDLSAVGWMLVPIALFHLGPVLLDASAWRTLSPPPRQALWVFAAARWVREGVNALLPAAQVGGEVVAVRLLSRLGARTSEAGAIVALDLATEFLSMVVVGGVGAGLLLATATPASRGAAGMVVLAMVPPLAIAALFLLAQRIDALGPLARRLEGRWPRVARGLLEARDAAAAAWANPRRLATAIGLHGLGWALGGVETWLMLGLLRHPLPIGQAFALEATSEVIRSLGFAIPGLLMAQEGSLVLIGGLVGLAPSAALSLSLFRRARDVALGLPALGAWQLVEHRRRGRAAGGRP